MSWKGCSTPGSLYVEPAAERATYEQQLAAARAAVGPAYQIGTDAGVHQPQAGHRTGDGRAKVPIRLRRSLSGPLPGLRREGGLFRHRAHAAPETVPGHHGPDRRRAHHLLGDRAGGDGNLSVVAAKSEPGVGRVAAAIAGKALCGAARPAHRRWLLRGRRRDRDLADRADLHLRLGQWFSVRGAEDRGLRLDYETHGCPSPHPKPKTCPSTGSSRLRSRKCPATT